MAASIGTMELELVLRPKSTGGALALNETIVGTVTLEVPASVSVVPDQAPTS